MAVNKKGQKSALKDLQAEILRLKREREDKRHDVETDAQNLVETSRVKLAILPILQTFAEMDRMLEIQSNDSPYIYITYAHFKVCRLTVTATSLGHITVEMQTDRRMESVFSGSFNEKAIREAVKDALLDWYRSLR